MRVSSNIAVFWITLVLTIMRCRSNPNIRVRRSYENSDSSQCTPFEYQCQYTNTQPLRSCFAKTWKCDGEDDCGNGFDERDCSTTSTSPCNATVFACDMQRNIPVGWLCDRDIDCANSRDEMNCQWPLFRQPTQRMEMTIPLYSRMELECAAEGHPPPELIWFHNHYPKHGSMIQQKVCEKRGVVTYHRKSLIIDFVRRGDSGTYKCEAMNALGRIESYSYEVTVR